MPRTLLLVVTVLYFALAFGSALTKRPWSDEGHLACAGYNLAEKGFLGTTVMEENTRMQQGIGKHTYYVMPLGIVIQASWYKLFGLSLLSMRSASIVSGFLAVIAWLLVARALSGDKSIALLSAVLIATDYTFLMGASVGRVDVICSAFGVAAWACYLCLRNKNLIVALLASHALVTASGLTHPIGALYFAGLVFLMIHSDRKSLFLRHYAVCAVPYLIGAMAWGVYILQSPSDFLAQFTSNATIGGRMSSLLSPLSALHREVMERYFIAFGLGRHSVGHSGPIYLKIFILLAYISGVLAALLISQVRKQRGVRSILALTGIMFALLTLLDGQKLTFYLVHILPLYALALAVSLRWIWTRLTTARWLVGLFLAGMIALQTGGAVLRMRQDTYHKRYAPAVAFLKQNQTTTGLVMGSAQFGFDLGFDGKLIDDPYLGYTSKKTPDTVIVDDLYVVAFEDIKKRYPDVYHHIQARLAEYHVVYDKEAIKIFQRSGAQDSRGSAEQ